VLAGLDGDHHFGADAVVAGDQNRVAVSGRFEIEQSAESAQRGVGTGARCRLGQRFNGLDQRVSGVNIDPGVFVG
jgi:hypothetical protein